MDVLRGCAVMGILWMNVTAFAFPEAAYSNPVAAGPLSTGDILFWATGFILFDGKMRGLFSLLFGASMLLLIDREEMAGRDGRRSHQVRMGWLFAFGLTHYLLLWAGDILMTYAVVGVAALAFVRLEPLALVKRAFLAFAAHFLLCAIFVASLYIWAHSASAPDASSATKAAFMHFIAGMTDPASPAALAETAIYRGEFAGVVLHHLSGFPGQWLWTLMFSALDSLGFMLLGMAMLKAGFLTGRWDAAQYWRTARHCFLIGLPPMAALAVWTIISGFAPLTTIGIVLAWSFPLRIPLTVGWAALILWLIARHRGSPLVTRLAATGRLALSNYLGTSLALAALFYGWCLGWFGTVRLAQLPLIIAAGWTTMLIWSPMWQRNFAMGPVEWLWRSLAAGQTQKIRKNR
ncbi:DUF418 domain-containing protein [Sphingobium sp. AN558]